MKAKVVKMAITQAELDRVSKLIDAKAAAAPAPLQVGSTTERGAIKDHIREVLKQINADLKGGSVLPDVRFVLEALIAWIGKREQRTDAREGGL